MDKKYKLFIGLLAASAAGLGITALALEQPLSADTYYLPAEAIRSQGDETVFGQVDGEEPSVYLYTAPGNYPDDAPYLLTMDPQGTEDPSDDTVLVVWRCVSDTAQVSSAGSALPQHSAAEETSSPADIPEEPLSKPE